MLPAQCGAWLQQFMAPRCASLLECNIQRQLSLHGCRHVASRSTLFLTIMLVIAWYCPGPLPVQVARDAELREVLFHLATALSAQLAPAGEAPGAAAGADAADCVQAVLKSCLAPLLRNQLCAASFQDMAARWGQRGWEGKRWGICGWECRCWAEAFMAAGWHPSPLRVRFLSAAAGCGHACPALSVGMAWRHAALWRYCEMPAASSHRQPSMYYIDCRGVHGTAVDSHRLTRVP
jgi:hypothetical protein